MRAYPSAANFFWVRCEGIEPQRLRAGLEKRRIRARWRQDAPGFVRLTALRPQDNEYLLAALDEVGHIRLTQEDELWNIAIWARPASRCLRCAWARRFAARRTRRFALRLVQRALDLGCNFIDTALYGGGRSEQVVGKAIKGRREEVVLTTKIFGTLGNSPNHMGLSRVNLLRGIEASLQRLQTDYVDLYLLHSF